MLWGLSPEWGTASKATDSTQCADVTVEWSTILIKYFCGLWCKLHIPSVNTSSLSHCTEYRGQPTYTNTQPLLARVGSHTQTGVSECQFWWHLYLQYTAPGSMASCQLYIVNCHFWQLGLQDTTHFYTATHTCTQTHTHTHTCTRTHTRTHTCTLTHTHAHAHTRMYLEVMWFEVIVSSVVWASFEWGCPWAHRRVGHLRSITTAIGMRLCHLLAGQEEENEMCVHTYVHTYKKVLPIKSN